MIDHVGRELTVSKIKEDCFGFTGLDIKVVDDGIEVSMEDYTNSLQDIKNIRKVENFNEPLTKLKMKEYQKITGKIAWLANSTRPDLSFTALQMSKKNKEATISDLRDVNRILKKVREQESRIKYEHIGEKEDLMVVGNGDTSLKTGDKAVGGVILFLTNSSMTRASPIYWKAKQINQVCHSSQDAETLNLLTMVEDLICAAGQLEQMLYGDISRRIPICLFTDSEATLESVTSLKQIMTKTLRVVIVDLKERLLNGEITYIALLLTE